MNLTLATCIGTHGVVAECGSVGTTQKDTMNRNELVIRAKKMLADRASIRPTGRFDPIKIGEMEKIEIMGKTREMGKVEVMGKTREMGKVEVMGKTREMGKIEVMGKTREKEDNGFMASYAQTLYALLALHQGEWARSMGGERETIRHSIILNIEEFNRLREFERMCLGSGTPVPLGPRPLAGFLLCNADLAGTDISGCDLTRAILVDADLRNAVCRGVSFFNANLSGASFHNADCLDADLRHTNCSGTRFTGATLTGARFQRSLLKKASFRNARCIGTSFDFSNCMNTDFCDAICIEASFRTANCEYAHLASAVCRDVDFTGTNLRNTRMDEHTVVDNCMFYRAGLEGSELKIIREQFYDDYRLKPLPEEKLAESKIEEHTGAPHTDMDVHEYNHGHEQKQGNEYTYGHEQKQGNERKHEHESGRFHGKGGAPSKYMDGDHETAVTRAQDTYRNLKRYITSEGLHDDAGAFHIRERLMEMENLRVRKHQARTRLAGFLALRAPAPSTPGGSHFPGGTHIPAGGWSAVPPDQHPPGSGWPVFRNRRSLRSATSDASATSSTSGTSATSMDSMAVKDDGVSPTPATFGEFIVVLFGALISLDLRLLRVTLGRTGIHFLALQRYVTSYMNMVLLHGYAKFLYRNVAFGEKPQYIVLLWFKVIILYAVVYLVTDIRWNTIENASFGKNGALDYLYFSVVTFTTLGYGDLRPLGYMRLVAGSEAIIGVILMSYFVVVWAHKVFR